jgi:hypothetical protein
MKVKSIDLDDNGYPETVTVVMTRKEAQLIAKWTGSNSPLTTDEFLPGHGRAGSAIYYALSRCVFHPFWADGVDDAIAGCED